MKKLILIALLAAVCFTSAAWGYTLPEGSVQGLPKNLIVMDENGNSPNDGELYIEIENMIPHEVYTKDITVMNARDDAQYSIYLMATPNYNEGDIDLLGETSCKLWLDDKLIYDGLVNGHGTPDISSSGVDLGGVYKSGESRKLHAEFVWNATGNEVNDTDNSYYGVVSFHWIFYAQVSAPSDNPGGGGGGNHGGGGGGYRNPSKTPSSETETQKTVDGDTDEGNPDSPKNTENDNSNDNNDTNNDSDSNVNNEPGEEHENEDSSTPADSPNSPDQSIDKGKDKSIPDKIADKIVKKLPFIPEDVKTGYYSELVFYVKLAAGAFGAALLLLAVIIHKMIKLKKLKSSVK